MDVQTLRDILEEMGVEQLSTQGNEVRASCPFPSHEDSTPSFFANPENGSFCFSCGKKHHTIQALLDELAQITGVGYFDPVSWIDADTLFDFSPPVEEMAHPMQKTTLRHYIADTEYFLKDWGVSEVVERRQLRLDPYTGHEVFPILDEKEILWGFVERFQGPKRSIYRYPAHWPKKNYLLGENDTRRDEVWVVEGVRDLCHIESKVPGARAVALGGWTMSREQIRKLHRFRRIVLCLDNDDAGRKGTREARRRLPLSGLYIANYRGKDPAEAKGFEVHHAVW